MTWAATPRPTRGSRYCRKCGDPKPVRDFPLLDDPKAVERKWATRHWCGPCLVAGRHITKRAWQRHLDTCARNEAKARERVREYEIACALHDLAMRDPVYERAMRRSLATLKIARRPAAEKESGSRRKTA